MTMQKLNSRGFSHDIILVLFVAIFAIGGVAYLVASHADSCLVNNVSGPVSVAVSGTMVTPVSGVVSAPASGAVCNAVSAPASSAVSATTVAAAPSSSAAPATTPAAIVKPTAIPAGPQPTPAPHTINAPADVQHLLAQCSLSNVPLAGRYNQYIYPVLRIVNTGNVAFVPQIRSQFLVVTGTHVSYDQSQNISMPLLQPGHAYQRLLTVYRTPLKTNSAINGIYRVNSTTPQFNCSAHFTVQQSSFWKRYL